MNTEDMFPVNPYITNYKLYGRWKAIEKFLTNYHTYKETRGGLIINEQFIIAVNTSKMRPVGQLDWSWYTPKTLAEAMDCGEVYVYYEQMLLDPRSDKNKWKRPEEEMEKKTLYAVRSGMAEFLL